MSKIRILLITLGIICTLSSYAQEEFFKNNTGLSVSGSSNFSTSNEGSLSLHLKNGLIFSGSIILPNEGIYNPTITTIGYLFDLNKKSEKDKLNIIISLSDLSIQSDLFRSISPTLGIMYTSFNNEDYPTSLGLSTSAYIEDYYPIKIAASDLSFYFAQAFFASKTVYPLVGLTYSIPLTHEWYTQSGGSFLFHVGLNIRLSKPDAKLKE